MIVIINDKYGIIEDNLDEEKIDWITTSCSTDCSMNYL